uniref:Uncharacterized protein n=1 Tax=Anopheles albimanus TaxID=7167 RepID=A0A182FAD3_ANOAL
MTSFRGAIKRLNCDSKISAIFFDLDNTLIATRKADAKASSKIAFKVHENDHQTGHQTQQADTGPGAATANA